MTDGWGWNPTTFSAVGTVGASSIALTALLATLRQSAKARKTEERRQADQVAAYRFWGPEELTGNLNPDVLTVRVHLVNSSSLPIHRLGVVVLARRGEINFDSVLHDYHAAHCGWFVRFLLAHG